MSKLGIGLVWSDVFGCCTSAVLSSHYGKKNQGHPLQTHHPVVELGSY